MAKKPKIEVDEDLMRQMIAGQAPLTSKVVRRIPDDEPEDTHDAPRETPDAEEQSPSSDDGSESRHRQNDPRIRLRRTFLAPANFDKQASLYVGTATKRKLLEIFKRIGGERLTATAYIDNILRHHIEVFREEINRIYKKRNPKKYRLTIQKLSNHVLRSFFRAAPVRYSDPHGTAFRINFYSEASGFFLTASRHDNLIPSPACGRNRNTCH